MSFSEGDRVRLTSIGDSAILEPYLGEKGTVEELNMNSGYVVQFDNGEKFSIEGYALERVYLNEVVRIQDGIREGYTGVVSDVSEKEVAVDVGEDKLLLTSKDNVEIVDSDKRTFTVWCTFLGEEFSVEVEAYSPNVAVKKVEGTTPEVTGVEEDGV